MTDLTRIFIVDDHEVVRRGIRLSLQSQSWVEICGEAGTGREAVRLVSQLTPNLVVMDFHLPDLGGLELIRALVRAHAGVKILVFSMDVTDADLRQLVPAGAHGCVFKTDAASELLVAVETVRKGERYVPERLIKLETLKPGEPPLPPPGTHPLSILTNREREVATLLASGRSNKETASDLGISIKTAETHRARVMRKLRLRTFADLVQLAIRTGLIKL